MNLLFRVIDAAYCTSSHHRMALDALALFSGPEAFLRRNLFLFHHQVYLKGSKAPDDSFKDFRNHVLHVKENLWGGAPQAARDWYDRTVEELRRSNWEQAAYSAGVLSHYVTDPFQPFHTGSSDKETHYHRAVEWSVAKSFPALRERIDASGGYPRIELSNGRDWLEETILAGAERAHLDYALPFERFDLAKGSKTPEEGLDETLQKSFASLIAQATATFAAILERACVESQAIPPDLDMPTATVIATLKAPIAFVLKKLVEHEEQRTVLAIYEEIQRTGKLTRYLPEECHAIDMLHAKERLDSMPISQFAKRRAEAAAAKKGEAKPSTAVESVRPAPLSLTSGGRNSPEPVVRGQETSNERAAVAPAREKVSTPAKESSSANPFRTPVVDARPTVENSPKAPVVPPRPVVAAAPTPAPRERVAAEPPKSEARPTVAATLPMPPKETPRTVAEPPQPTRSEAPASATTPTKEPLRAEAEPRVTQSRPMIDFARLFSPGKAAQEARQEVKTAQTSTPTPDAKRPAVDRESAAPSKERPAAETNRPAAASLSNTSKPSAPAPATSSGGARRWYLEPDSDVVDAPSIGPKTAKRFEQIGVRTVAEFLRSPADKLAQKLNAEHLSAAKLREWQLQAKLVIRVAGLRGHDAQFLVGAGYTEPEEIASAKPEGLLADVLEYVRTSDGQRALRSGAEPDLAEAREWIDAARKPRPLAAAAA